jgi:hypothetical protein
MNSEDGSVCESASGVCKTFRQYLNPKPIRRGQTNYQDTIIRHGLVKCSNCNLLWNRDVNAACNIWKIAHHAIHGYDRPLYLQRRKEEEEEEGN